MTSRASTTAHAEWSEATNKSYISTVAFDTKFYSYSTTLEGFTTRGTLTLNPGASPTQCPAGRILNVNGRRLVPGVNPMDYFGNSGLTAPLFLLGVYDSVSMLNGFIDPKSDTFSVYDANRPPSDYLVDSSASEGLGGIGEIGANAYVGKLNTGSTFVLNTLEGLSNAGIIYAGSASAGTINFNLVGEPYGTVSYPNGNYYSYSIVTTAVTENSVVLLTKVNSNPLDGPIWYNLFPGGFAITIPLPQIVSWLVVN